MKRLFLLTLTSILILIQCKTKINDADEKNIVIDCSCDTTKAIQIISNEEFNKLSKYDTITFLGDSLYSLSAEENRKLWYRDIEHKDTSKFTKYWNSYAPNNYHANHLDFVKYYENKSNIDMAFQFGPNRDLWAYHIFVIKKLDCCYLATRSYFRHARFTYKAYAIINGNQVDSLHRILEPINKLPIDSSGTRNYSGYFVDNRNKTKFHIDFNKEVKEESNEPKEEINNLYEFVDKKITWTVTFDL